MAEPDPATTNAASPAAAVPPAAPAELPEAPREAALCRRQRERLRHVLWLGGSACSGKTEAARRLAAAHGVATYHTDEAFERHRRRADPRRHPAFCRVAELSNEDLWRAPAAKQAVELLAFHGEHLEMVIEDLLRSAPGQPLLVEGSCLLPARIAEVTFDPSQALWLVATPGFRRRHYLGRGPWVQELLASCASPAEAFRRWMDRDDALSAWRQRELERLRLPWQRIDGRLTSEAVAAAAATHFGLSR